jgi:hypothetical protein
MMNHLVISVTDEELQNKSPMPAFDDKLRKALSDPSLYIVITLHPVLGCGIDLLEWLESWQNRFLKIKKKFFIIPGNVNQLECLEVSHPDQALRYVSSMDEFDVAAALFPEPVTQNATGQDAPLVSAPITPQETAPIQPAAVDEPTPQKIVIIEPAPLAAALADDDVDNAKNTPPTPAIHMAVGTVVETSGEYICLSCQTSRMWLKGDITTKCTNPECTGSETGWEMTFELF